MKLFVIIFYPSIVQWEFGLVFYNLIKSHKEQKSNLINWRILIENVFVRHIVFVKNVSFWCLVAFFLETEFSWRTQDSFGFELN